jgi:hypothetical protein
VSKVVRLSHLCVLFLGSCTVCLTAWVTGARRMILEVSLLIASTGNEMTHITVAAWRSSGYKYLLRSSLGTISHSFSSSLSYLGFPSLVLTSQQWRAREASSENAPPPRREVLRPTTPRPLCRHRLELHHLQDPRRGCLLATRSPVLEQGGPFRKAPVIDLSSFSDEEDFIADTSRDFEFTQRLYDELNCDLLEPRGDDKVIILSDSDKEKEEAREEKSVGVEDTTASGAFNPVSTASAYDIGTPAEKSSTPAASLADATEDPGAAPNDSSDDLALSPKMEEGSGGGDEVGAN